MTLAFPFAAIKRLADPTGVFRDAMEWCEYVGIVSSRPQHVVLKYARDHDLPTHFMPRPDGDKAETLSDVRGVSTEYEATDRYVFVGTSPEDRDAAEHAGWEYLPVEDAAEASGWALGEAPAEPASGLTIDEERRDDWP